MAIITTRAAKGMALTHNEVDDNFLNINASLTSYDSAFSIATDVLTFLDTIKFQDPAAPTKIGQFSFAGITAGTTAVYTFPNVTGALASLGNLSQTFSGTTAFIPSGSGALTFGSTGGTGLITLGQSTAAQTVDIARGATATATIKTVNIGTAGLSGSTTNINFGSAVAGATTNITLNSGTANGVTYLNGSKVLTSGTALTFDGTGLGIGAASPFGKLNVANGAGKGFEFWPEIAASTNALFNFDRTGGTYQDFQVRAATHQWLIGASEAMRLTSTGLGIGTSSPAQKLSIQGASFPGSAFSGQAIGDGSAERIRIGYKDGTPDTGLVPAQIVTSAAVLQIASRDTGTGAITFATGTGIPERMRLDASGNLLVGQTSTGATNANSMYFNPTTGYGANLVISHLLATPGGREYQQYLYNGTAIGSITQNGTTGVAYNTSSDYRLKDITGPITTSGAYIDSLNPVEGTWKADGSTFVGLIAHETQEASRTPVATGTKDGEQMQGMDYSSAEIIANLIAELQDLRKRLAAAGI